MCMRAGLYQTKNGLLVRRGSLRSRKSITLAEISSSTVFDRSSVSGPSSLQRWFASVPSEDLHHRTLRGGVRQVVVWGSTAPGTSGSPGIGVFLHGGAMPCCVGVLLISRKLTCCIDQVVQVAPELLEAVRRRQRVSMVTEMVLAELAGVVAQVMEELCERRRAGSQVRRATGE